MKSPALSVVLPTYNESKTIGMVIKKINDSIAREGEIIIVDDNSPDQTADIARKSPSRMPVRVIVRKDERGLASAVLRGMNEARGKYVCVMDADLSHPPSIIPKMVEQLEKEKEEIAIASRYAKGGGVEDWPFYRKMVSVGATFLSRPLTKTTDPMSGFFLVENNKKYWKRLNPIGYKILLELLVRNDMKKIIEVPYRFENRKVGKSNLSGKQYGEYLLQLKSLYWDKITRVFSHGRV